MKENNSNFSWLNITRDILQIIFFILIGCATIYNLYLTRKQDKLIFKPVIGITDVKTTRLLSSQDDKFANVLGVKIQFFIENVGSLPAKNFKVKITGRLGDTVLPYTESKSDEGITMIPNTKYTNDTTIGLDIIKRMIEEKQRLIYTIELSYSDWEGYNKYSYPTYLELYLIQKEPLNVGFKLLSAKEAI